MSGNQGIDRGLTDFFSGLFKMYDTTATRRKLLVEGLYRDYIVSLSLR